MLKYLAASILSGVLFGAMDSIIQGNSLAQRLFAVYKPISKQSINVIAGLVIDLAYGFIIAGIFLLLYNSLPGKSWLLKGLSFSIFIWFFRVVMYVASQWMMFEIPFPALIYSLCTGLLEMLVLGIVCGFALKR